MSRPSAGLPGFVFEEGKTRAAAGLDFLAKGAYNWGNLRKEFKMTEDEKFEEMVKAETMQITVRLPKRAEAGFESWRRYLQMSKGAFAVLCIRVGMKRMGELLTDKFTGEEVLLPPDDAFEIIDRAAPDEKEY